MLMLLLLVFAGTLIAGGLLTVFVLIMGSVGVDVWNLFAPTHGWPQAPVWAGHCVMLALLALLTLFLLKDDDRAC